jgi:putative endonuclease
MSIFYVYILEVRGKRGKKSYYTGYTNNLHRRLSEHRNGKGAKYCRSKKFELKYFETYIDRKSAMRRELEIKSYPKQKKKELINGLVD